MSRFAIRKLSSDDFAALATLETDVFGAMGEQVSFFRTEDARRSAKPTSRPRAA